MNWLEIARTRITGVSTPWLGASWNPPQSQKEIAKKLITFLEDRRVLYNPSYLESPSHCVTSIIEIRKFLTDLLISLDENTDLGIAIRTIRAACRKFLDTISHYESSDTHEYRYRMGMGDQFIFDTGIGELRGAVGLELAKIIVMFKLNCEGELLTILPSPID